MSAVIAFSTDTVASPLPHAPREPGASGLIHEVINPAHPWEIAVGRAVAEQLPDINGYILTGLELCDLKQRLIEIDNLLVCDRGVFVIECKSIRGRIEGGLNLPWEIVQGESRKPLYGQRGINPRHQCRQQLFTVVEALERIGVRRDFWVNGAVIFPDQTEFDLGSVPVDTYAPAACPVYHLSAFIQALASLPRQPGPATEPEELGRLVRQLRR